MIHTIRFSNFYSFLEAQEVSFVVNKRAPDTTGYVQSAFGPRLTRVLALFGANGSGKTNALRAVGFLRRMMVASYGFAPDEKLPFSPFHGRAAGEPTEFETTFELDGRLLRYSLIMNGERIVRERLAVKSLHGNFRQAVLREFDVKSQCYSTRINRKANLFAANIQDKALRHRGNASLIAIAAQAEEPLCRAIQDYWKRIHVDPGLSGDVAPGCEVRLQRASEFFHRHEEHLRTAEKLARKWDLGLERIQVRRLTLAEGAEPYGPASPLEAIASHTSAGRRFDLPMHLESSGTQALFVRFSEILPVLDSGNIAAIDEIDADLHPYVVEAMVDQFRSCLTARQSQLICTLHSTTIMNTLDMYQIAFVEKGEDLTSEMYRLDEFKGIRERENYFGRYLAGAYGAIPDISP